MMWNKRRWYDIRWNSYLFHVAGTSGVQPLTTICKIASMGTTWNLYQAVLLQVSGEQEHAFRPAKQGVYRLASKAKAIQVENARTSERHVNLIGYTSLLRWRDLFFIWVRAAKIRLQINGWNFWCLQTHGGKRTLRAHDCLWKECWKISTCQCDQGHEISLQHYILYCTQSIL